MNKVNVKPAVKTAFRVLAAVITLALCTSCTFSLAPAWKTGTTAVSFSVSTLDAAIASSAGSSRAVTQGSGLLYIQTGSTADAILYGPFATSSDGQILTDQIPAGTYPEMYLIYMSNETGFEWTLPKIVPDLAAHQTFREALVSDFSDIVSRGVCPSWKALTAVDIVANRTNQIGATLIPLTNGFYSFASANTQEIFGLDTAQQNRMFIQLTDVPSIAGGVAPLLIGIHSSSTPGSCLRYLALYDSAGNLLSAVAPNIDPLVTSSPFQLPYSTLSDSVAYLYVEYQGTSSQSAILTFSYGDNTYFVRNSGSGVYTSSATAVATATTGAETKIYIAEQITPAVPLAISTGTVSISSAYQTSGSPPFSVTPNSVATSAFSLSGTGSLTLSDVTINGGSGLSSGIITMTGTSVLNLCKGATLTGNISGRGVVMIDGNAATFNLAGGTISDCTATASNGGGVYMSGGTMNFTGGEITGCSANYGGAVSMTGAANFTMSGGTIDNCSVTSGGGGVHYENTPDESAPVTLSGGTITDCTAATGGGVYTNNCTLTFAGTIVTGCKALTYGGGGVYTGEGSLVLTAAPANSVTGNTAFNTSAMNAYISQGSSASVTDYNRVFGTGNWGPTPTNP